MQPMFKRRQILSALMALSLPIPVLAASPSSFRKSEIQVPGNRRAGIWTWKPKKASRGVILFSHGALSAPWKYERLIAYWVEAGFTVHAPLHVDSSDHPHRADYPGLASWRCRIEDMRALADKYGKKGFVAAGHSYGALGALTLAGAGASRPEGISGPLADSRAKLALAFSPPGLIPNLIDAQGYAGISVPMLLQTGTRDIPPGEKSWEGHLAAFDAVPATGDKFALVLEGVDHYFGGGICRPELPGPAQLDELSIAAAISVLMLDAYTKKSRTAEKALTARLSENGPVLLKRK